MTKAAQAAEAENALNLARKSSASRARLAAVAAYEFQGDAVSDAALVKHAETGTEGALAQLLARRFSKVLRYVDGQKSWACYDGARWALGSDLQARAWLQEIVRDIFRAGASAAGTGDRTALCKFALHCDKKSFQAGALALAEPQLAVKLSQFDVNPWLLNVSNGTIDLRTGQLGPHRPEDWISRLCPVEYHHDAAAPRFKEIVAWAMKGRASLVSYLKRAAGYSATGSPREQVFLFAYGAGGNGKSTILGAIVDTLGGDYGVRAMPDLLTAAQGERHSTELAHLRGARMVLCSETEDGRHLAVQRMKMLTGEGSITARGMRQNPTTFEVNATLWLQSNHRPQITEQTRAVWRRVRVIPFDATIEHEDKKLSQQLKGEQPGILRWIVEGAGEWFRDGLGTPPEVQSAVEDYRRASDTLASFVSDCCETGADIFEQATPLYEAYRSYCAAEDASRPLDPKKFKAAMVERGYRHEPRREYVVYLGLRLARGPAGAAVPAVANPG